MNLANLLLQGISDLFASLRDVTGFGEPPIDAVEERMKVVFNIVDDALVQKAAQEALAADTREVALDHLSLARSGSCAILAFYDSCTRLLRVANVGDSRAVLGRRVSSSDGSGHYYAVYELTVDQNGHNPAEESRLLSQHPGELIIQRGRVLGWGVSRAFGNGTYKWPLSVQEQLVKRKLIYPPPPNVKTPPYLIAEPEVTTIEVRPGDFLILASDGLWEWMTNEDAVGLVGWWLDEKPPGSKVSGQGAPRTLLPKELPVRGDHDPDAVRVRIPNTEPYYVNIDENAATHLVRNALGGADEELRRRLLEMEAPESRRRRCVATSAFGFHLLKPPQR